VHNGSESLVSGATVSGIWGSSTSVSCTTDASGSCSTTVSVRRAPSASFSVTNIVYTGSTYNAGDNHDPDGDSNGTMITVNAP
jgi:hypothetical protein